MAEDLRVAVVRGESLLEQGVLRALLALPGLEVEVVPGDAADLAAALRSFQPHAVIADEMDREFINYILARSPGTIVVTMSLRTPTVAVYRSRVAEVTSVKDLVDQLRIERKKMAVALEETAGPRTDGAQPPPVQRSEGCR